MLKLQKQSKSRFETSWFFRNSWKGDVNDKEYQASHLKNQFPSFP